MIKVDNSRFSKQFIWALCSFALFAVLSRGGVFKYVFFMVWVLVISFLYNRKGSIFIVKDYLLVLLPNIIYIIFGLIACINSEITFYALKEILFILCPSIGAIILRSNISEDDFSDCLDALFVGLCIYAAYTSIASYFNSGMTETQYAFSFGIFFVYYIYKNKKLFAILSALLLIVSNKRIASAACVIAFIVCFLLKRKKRNETVEYTSGRKVISFIGLFTMVILIVYVYLCKSQIINVIYSEFQINSQGRLSVWNKVNEYYEFTLMYFGRGLGSTSALLEEFGINAFSNLHNDILVIYIDLGMIGFCAYIYSWFHILTSFVKKHLLLYSNLVICIITLVYTFMCFSTDNIRIYINYLFPVYCIMLSCIESDEEKINKAEYETT